MKKSEIKNKYPNCDITINSREARKILIDLGAVETVKELMPETKMLMKYLKELYNTQN